MPIDLRALCGHCYKIALDEAAGHESGGKNDPWYYLIPCERGHISPFSDKHLAYYCCGTKIRARLRRDHPELEVRQWSDDGEAVFLFTPDALEIVAEYAKPKKRRRLSPEQREQFVAVGRRSRFVAN